MANESSVTLGLPHVLGARPNLEMVGVHAGARVAEVHYVKTRRNGALEMTIGNAMHLVRPTSSPATLNASVAIPTQGPGPQPAPVGLLHLLHEAINRWAPPIAARARAASAHALNATVRARVEDHVVASQRMPVLAVRLGSARLGLRLHRSRVRYVGLPVAITSALPTHSLNAAILSLEQQEIVSSKGVTVLTRGLRCVLSRSRHGGSILHTPSGLAGSQSDGDGVYVRTRWVNSSARFLRIPDHAPAG